MIVILAARKFFMLCILRMVLFFFLNAFSNSCWTDYVFTFIDNFLTLIFIQLYLKEEKKLSYMWVKTQQKGTAKRYLENRMHGGAKPQCLQRKKDCMIFFTERSSKRKHSRSMKLEIINYNCAICNRSCA